MTRGEAEQLLGYLVGATTGWTHAPDETFQFYTEHLMALREHDVAVEAVRLVAATWSEARRPPAVEINNAYTAVMRRRMMERPQLMPSRTVYPSITEGRQIAARAYADECARRRDDDPLIISGYRTNQPSERHLAALLGGTVTAEVER